MINIINEYENETEYQSNLVFFAKWLEIEIRMEFRRNWEEKKSTVPATQTNEIVNSTFQVIETLSLCVILFEYYKNYFGLSTERIFGGRD